MKIGLLFCCRLFSLSVKYITYGITMSVVKERSEKDLDSLTKVS